MFKNFRSKVANNYVDTLYTEDRLAGTKYNSLGSRTGLASALDAGLIKKQIADEKNMWGKGYVQYNVLSGDKDAPMNIGGRLFYPDGDGTITIIDSDLVDEQQRKETEKRKYLEDIIEKCSMSDEICALILAQPNVEQLKKNFLGAGASGIILESRGAGAGIIGARAGSAIITDQDLIAVNAMPSALETYDPTSITFSRAIQKFKLIVKAKLPALQSMTNKTVQNEA